MPRVSSRSAATALPKPLLLEAGKGDDKDSVGAGVGKFTAGDDHQQVRLAKRNLLLFLIMSADQFDEFFQVGSTFLDLAAAQLALNQGVPAVVAIYALNHINTNISTNIGGKICGNLTVRFVVKWR